MVLVECRQERKGGTHRAHVQLKDPKVYELKNLKSLPQYSHDSKDRGCEIRASSGVTSSDP